MIDSLWLLISTVLVFIMQAGFTCLESGLVRKKNSINVAAKNLIDFLISAFIFWVCGYALLNGTSLGGWVGYEKFFFYHETNHNQASLFLFQLMFCSTAVTLVSGAVAERISFKAYLILTLIMSLLIYPLFAHWVWNSQGWLATLGYIDFAGASVVHALGGVFALAAIIIIGPRIGQFDSPQGIPNSNLPMTTIGVFLIWLGWIGFNGGSTFSLSTNVPSIIINTMLGGIGGGLAITCILLIKGKKINLLHILNGVLTGLVSITASANIVTSEAALIIGILGGFCYFVANRILLYYHIDDVVGAFPVHGVGGIWAIIAVALFGNNITLQDQLPIQLLGLMVLIFWAFGLGYGLLWGINKVYPLRVSRVVEIAGLNISEHGTNTIESELIREMEQQRQSGDFSTQVAVSVHSDIGKISAQYNLVTAKMNQALNAAKIAHKVKTTFLRGISHEYRTPLNHILGFAQILQFRNPPLDQEEQESINHIIESGQSLLALLDNILAFSDLVSNEKPLLISSFDLNELVEKNIHCYQAMINKKQIQVDNRLATLTLPSFISDKDRVDKILHQLILNAVLYNRIEGIISINAELLTNNIIRISIQDTGIGIPKESTQAVFEPFNRLNQAESGLVSGVGIGLSMAKILINDLDGKIGFDSKVNEGTTFWFELPITNSQ